MVHYTVHHIVHYTVHCITYGRLCVIVANDAAAPTTHHGPTTHHCPHTKYNIEERLVRDYGCSTTHLDPTTDYRPTYDGPTYLQVRGGTYYPITVKKHLRAQETATT